MAIGAERLVITSIPELFLIAAVRIDVIDYRSLDDLTAPKMISAQRMRSKKPSSILLPARSVPALC